MKIYFAASLSGKAKYQKNYERIIDVLTGLGYKLVSDHVLNTEYNQVRDASDKELVKYYERTLKNISSADLVVAEVSQPTIGIGHEISIALEKNKPVLVLQVSGSLVPQILKAVPTNTVRIVKYTLENIEEVLTQEIANLKGSAPIRFNFFISPEINDYLDWISRVKRVPRAVYLRDLLGKEMEKNKEYKPL
ncbi:MAG: nucleoside 2-deoxyribosyltransferase [Patescibacteria group bacterium]|nr:nucleoside 2-deoxyribosyltransferase [Patescibacteria group bacterium]